jgi:hypothetical protein
MRRLATTFLIIMMLWLTACSYANMFVVVNSSDHAIEVWYKFKKPTAPGMSGPLPDLPPLTKPASQVGEQVAWQQLPAARYKIDSDNHTVVLTLNPGEALQLEICEPAGGGSEGDCESDAFFIEEISLVGANGEVHLKGEQVHKSFVAESKHLYTLAYK